MAAALDGKDSLFFPGMRRWDGEARVTNSWNKLNNVRAVFPLLLVGRTRPADYSRIMSCISRTVTSLFTCESQGKQQEVRPFEFTHRNWHRKIYNVSSTDP
jgi:hypothetical protein